ncbi:hypothetical protein Poly51_11060 [Rubripirellula tenax]|uniref:Uncharacterized protein n=1 Tax=Rubripirellula tenax TaxID=2528015 RepID=A0A5C6FJ36_9BACT|nr:hypothetical protein Poly51_11060 [Rubripirellula tenax]
MAVPQRVTQQGPAVLDANEIFAMIKVIRKSRGSLVEFGWLGASYPADADIDHYLRCESTGSLLLATPGVMDSHTENSAQTGR